MYEYQRSPRLRLYGPTPCGNIGRSARGSSRSRLFTLEALHARGSSCSGLFTLEALHALGALDEEGLLSRLGRKMAEFPLEPNLSKMLILSVDLGCSEEILTITAMLSVESPFFRPRDKQAQADMRIHGVYRSARDKRDINAHLISLASPPKANQSRSTHHACIIIYTVYIIKTSRVSLLSK
jgi:HrpA-like RNA helicase